MSDDLSRELADLAHKQAAKQLGLWDRIRMKKERGGKPAQPGDKDYPDAKSWKKVTNISQKNQKQAGDTACSCGCGDTVTTCKCGADCSCRKPGGSCYKSEKSAAKSPAWQRSEGKNEEGGLNAKGRASYNKATGGNLKAPVTESDPKGDRAKRQNSFCARMCGMKRVNTGAKSKKDPDSRINKSLRKWNCKCGSAREFGELMKKQALFPLATTLGTLGGAATGKSGDRLRAAGRGAVKGLGTDIGMAGGVPLGMLLGLPFGPTGLLAGGVAGGVGGGMIGNSLASGLIGPYETDVEKLERLLAAREQAMKETKTAFDFGVKLAEMPKLPVKATQGIGANYPTRPTSVQLPGFRPVTRGDNIFEEVDMQNAAAKARPDSTRSRANVSQNVQDFKKTWNPLHMGKAVGNSLIGASQDMGESVAHYFTNDPNELAFQNTQYDVAAAERARAQQARATKYPNRNIFSKQEPNIFEEVDSAAPVSIDGGYVPANKINDYKAGVPGAEQSFTSAMDVAKGQQVKTNSARDFGRKLAAVTMCSAPEHNDQSGVDVNPAAAGTPEGKEKLTKKKKPVKAEDVVGKKANSLVNFVERKPKDMTHGNLNPRAAGEDEEDESHKEPEIQEDTDAYEFGKKVAQSAIEPVAAQRNAQESINELYGPREHRGLTPLGNSVFNAAGPATRIVGGALGVPYSGVAALGLDAANLVTNSAADFERLIEHPGIARRVAADHNAEFPDHPVTVPGAKPSAAVTPKVTPNQYDKPIGPEKGPPTAIDRAIASTTAGKSNPTAVPALNGAGESGSWTPWIAGGLGATGLAALAYYLAQQQEQKKKKREDDGLVV